MLNNVAIALLWASAGWLGYSYLIYPILLPLLSSFFGRGLKVREDDALPRVAFVVPVYNEELVVEKKIASILSLEYPPDLLQVWIGSDCSTDRTHELVRACSDPRVNLWVAPSRGGKTGVINRMAGTIDTDVLVMTDANTLHRTESLRAMVAPFADPQVGGVAGHIDHLVAGEQVVEERLYRSFESRQKTDESRLHSTISAFGGFYALRASLFRPIPPTAYSNDDVLIPMDIIRQNKRVVFEPRSVSCEDLSESFSVEFKRRIRIGAGNIQAFFWLLDFLDPLRGWPFFCYVSHKVTRWFSPLFVLLGLVACLLLVVAPQGGGYRFAAILVLAVVGCSAFSFLVRFKPGSVLFYFLAMNVGLGLGFVRFACGIRSAAWERTDRTR